MSPLQDSQQSPMQQLDGLLEKGAEAAYQMLLAIEKDDAPAVRAAADQLRFIRSQTKPASAAPGLSATPSALERMRCAAQAIATGETMLAQWTRQNIHRLSSEALPGADEQWQRLIDMALPAVWDFDNDLFVIFGDQDAALCDQLRVRGQRRVLFVGDEVASDPPSGYPDTLVVTREERLQASLTGFKRPYPNRVAALDLHGGQPLGMALADLEALIRKHVLSLWVNLKTTQEFAQRWVEQGIGNIPLVVEHQSLSVLDGRFLGLPAMLVAPGPSLDKNIHLLREAQGRAVIISPLQTLRRLHLAGIRPDFVLVLDPQDQTVEPFDFFKDVPDALLPALIVSVDCHPAVIRKFRQVYFYSSGGPVDHWFEEILGKPLVPLGAPSVALSALLLARHWQCSPITLLGQDLALQGDRQYAQGSNLISPGNRKLLPLRGYHGGTVQSPSDYYLFHHVFELTAKSMATHDPALKLFNCTEGGAFIDGFDHTPLRTVIDTHVTDDLAERHQAAMLGHVDPLSSDGARASAVRRLQSSLSTIDAAAALAVRCKRLSEVARPGSAALQRLGEEEKRLRTLVRHIKGFGIIFQGQIDEATQASAQAKSLPDNLSASRRLYRVISQGCAFIRPLVLRALSRVDPESHQPMVQAPSSRQAPAEILA